MAEELFQNVDLINHIWTMPLSKKYVKVFEASKKMVIGQ